ncbi:unnamed protein product [Mytilus coruscus]|uniref:Ig-like domain-containing protein n=1 Tax=Mytilus coruscus TaxID=42192 RepID=A0A6J8B7C5_MYTCO|nr:unnamed protein product [Mytilus coruscus]
MHLDMTVPKEILDVKALAVRLPQNVTGLLGENRTQIECSYTMENILRIDLVSFLIFNKSTTTFDPIASYLPDIKTLITPQGQNLKGRVTLRNITQSSTKAVMIFNKLLCIDDTFYKCNVIYVDSGGVRRDASSNTISISVQVPPSTPDNIALMSLTIKPVITEGNNVTCVCSGEVGKPPAKFIFQKYRRHHNLPMNYTSTSTSIQELSDNCSYYRTSYITFMLTADDNQAVIRCAVVSTIAEVNIYVDSAPFKVNYAVKMPTIVNHPNKTDYLVGLDTSISLKCTTDANPKPSYLWYKDNQIQAISTSETLTIRDVTTTNSGVYTCIVSNTFNDVIYTKRVQMHVCITKEGNKTQVMKQSNSENTAVIVVGTVCGSIILVLCVILFGVLQNKNKTFRCLLRRNRNDRSVDYVNTIQEQDPSLYEGVGQASDVHNYEQLSRREHLYNNDNFSNN